MINADFLSGLKMETASAEPALFMLSTYSFQISPDCAGWALFAFVMSISTRVMPLRIATRTGQRSASLPFGPLRINSTDALNAQSGSKNFVSDGSRTIGG